MSPKARVRLTPAGSILARVEIAGPSRNGALTVWPLVAIDSSDFAVLVLAGEALLARKPRWRATASALVAPRTSAEIELRSAVSLAARKSAGFEPVFDQLGFVAAVGDAIAGLEILGRAEVFARTYATLLDLAMQARTVAAPTPGIGEALRLRGRGIVGRGLVAEGVVHLSARWLGEDGEPRVKFA